MPRDRRSDSNDAAPDADGFIDAGGSTPDEGDTGKVKTFSTRFPEKLVDQIDEAIDSQIVSQSRNRWLMEAAVEKLKRERE
jgi:hypothetical protein